MLEMVGTQAEMGAQYGRLLQERGRLPETENTLSTLGRRMLEDANSRGALGQLQSMLLRGLTEFLLWRLHRHRLPHHDVSITVKTSFLIFGQNHHPLLELYASNTRTKSS